MASGENEQLRPFVPYIGKRGRSRITLLLATGSDAHVAGLRALAAERNMMLDEKGLRRGEKVVAAATEEAIYEALGMQTVPPELREGRDEIACALAGTLPSRTRHWVWD